MKNTEEEDKQLNTENMKPIELDKPDDIEYDDEQDNDQDEDEDEDEDEDDDIE